ncbi:hypothetical protein F5887DRAFT_961522 [Amanita rubescens]|nr:hypothetical protein F5887DRAFT_961522 [Amanita rubescens]
MSTEHTANAKVKANKKPPELGVGDILGAGDSHLVADVLSPDLSDVAFERLKEEVKWSTMFHRGGEVPRLVAVEGEVANDGCYPIYRHPADESPPLLPFSPTVSLIRKAVQDVSAKLGICGKDYISEHSDKTIDVVRGTNIVNVSIGAQHLRQEQEKLGESAAPRNAQRVPLPHNSMFVMGPRTNAEWLHAINHDNRPFQTKSEAEQFNNGERISLTFRLIGTFLTEDGKMIYGQGATGKTREEAKPVIIGTTEAEKLIQAFGEENQRSDFDWDASYGMGYDVLHFNPQ